MDPRASALFLAALLGGLGLLSGCREAGNPVAEYLDNAELQYETGAQKQNIILALDDILTLSEQELKAKRYADYTGQPGQWTLPTLIQKHFVPDQEAKTLGPRFYCDVKTAQVQTQVRRILDRLQAEAPADSQP